MKLYANAQQELYGAALAWKPIPVPGFANVPSIYEGQVGLSHNTTLTRQNVDAALAALPGVVNKLVPQGWSDLIVLNQEAGDGNESDPLKLELDVKCVLTIKRMRPLAQVAVWGRPRIWNSASKWGILTANDVALNDSDYRRALCAVADVAMPEFYCHRPIADKIAPLPGGLYGIQATTTAELRAAAKALFSECERVMPKKPALASLCRFWGVMAGRTTPTGQLQQVDPATFAAYYGAVDNAVAYDNEGACIWMHEAPVDVPAATAFGANVIAGLE